MANTETKKIWKQRRGDLNIFSLFFNLSYQGKALRHPRRGVSERRETEQGSGERRGEVGENEAFFEDHVESGSDREVPTAIDEVFEE